MQISKFFFAPLKVAHFLRQNLIRNKNCNFPAIHIFIPLVAACLFVGIMYFYGKKEGSSEENLIDLNDHRSTVPPQAISEIDKKRQ